MCEIITVTPIKNALSRRAHEQWTRAATVIELAMTSNTFADSYTHTQRGTLILAVMLSMAFICAVLAILMLKVFWLTTVFLAMVAWLFHSLTIEIGERELRWCFGPGLIRKVVQLDEIMSVTPVKTGLSWGIHWSPRLGWLYNVSGWDAVLVTLRDGKKFALGTDEPQVLATRLMEIIQPNKSATSHA